MNLSGTLKSIQQGMTNTKIPFARTPKVNNRTASPALYVTMPWAIIIYSCMVFYADTFSHNWGNAVFAGFNAVVTFWALTALDRISVRHCCGCRKIAGKGALMTQHNDWSAMQQSSYHDMQVDSLGAFSARNPLDSLAVTAPGRTRCVNAENPTGGKGTAATAASALGPSRKGSPCIQTVKAGESVTLMNVDGPGVIRHIWMTVTDRTSPTGPNVLRNLILEFYWDGEETPSVQCPIGDFFCCGHAQACRVNSMPVVVVPNRGFNCYFSMSFEHARIVLRNDHNEDVPAFFYQIDYTEYDSLPAGTMRFHAQWRRERVTELARDYVVLDGVQGRGAYIGTYLALTALESRWWGEGEVKMYIDGDDQYPTWCSTGAEDYFGGAWSFADFDEHGRMHEQTFCAPYVGFPFYSQRLASHRESAYWDVNTPVTRGLYRWHIPDPIYFEHDLRVEWQQIGTEEGGNFERQDDVASVAYWYQLEPHTPFTPIGDRHFRQPR